MRTAINAALWDVEAHALKQKMDYKGFIHAAAGAGYEGVEVGGTEETRGPAGEFRKFVEDQGLVIAAFFTSVTYNPYTPNREQYEKEMRYAAELGVKILTVCGGFIPNQRRNTYSFDYDIFAGNLGKAMEYARGLGLEIAFHPHRGCVVETIAETGEMVKRLPDFKICADIAHLEASGDDAAQFIRTFRDRIIFTHIKDYSWARDSFVELGAGDGKLNVAECIEELRAAGYDGWLSVELDKKWEEGDNAFELAKRCRAYLRKCGY
ncbi:MAG: sugar phosphate isomerase/epimerase family protein [Bacillota bacterium]